MFSIKILPPPKTIVIAIQTALLSSPVFATDFHFVENQNNFQISWDDYNAEVDNGIVFSGTDAPGLDVSNSHSVFHILGNAQSELWPQRSSG